MCVIPQLNQNSKFWQITKKNESINTQPFSDIILHAWCFLCWSLRNCVVWFINEWYEWVLDHINSNCGKMMISVKKQTFICQFQCVCGFFLHIDDHSRIILKRNVNSSDYINANYINVSIKKRSNMHASTSLWQRTLVCKNYILCF